MNKNRIIKILSLFHRKLPDVFTNHCYVEFCGFSFKEKILSAKLIFNIYSKNKFENTDKKPSIKIILYLTNILGDYNYSFKLVHLRKEYSIPDIFKQLIQTKSLNDLEKFLLNLVNN